MVAHEFPPQLGGPADQMGKRAKYLTRFGWQVSVLAPQLPEGEPTSAIAEAVPPGVEVHRVPYALARLAPSLRHDKHRPFDVRGRRARRLLDLLFLPRGYARWLPRAVRAGRPLARAADVILTVSNPITLHGIGYLLKRASGKPWVAELRDPITDYAHARRGPEVVNRSLERLVVRRADAIVRREDFVPDPVEERYPPTLRRKFIVLPAIGFDADDYTEPTEQPPRRLRSEPFRIAYTGRFYGDSITPRPFLYAYRAFLDRLGLEPAAAEAVFAGDWEPRFTATVEELSLGESVRYVGRLSRRECVALWRQSDVLLLILGVRGDDLMRIPSKFWDYVGARRPILALAAPHGRVAQLVNEQHLGAAADGEDVADIVATLERLYARHRSGELKAAASAAFLAASTREASEREVSGVLARLADARHG